MDDIVESAAHLYTHFKCKLLINYAYFVRINEWANEQCLLGCIEQVYNSVYKWQVFKNALQFTQWTRDKTLIIRL